MQILEHGQEQEQTLLFFPCTAEPVWAFPPERFTLPGHDPVKEYDTMEVYLKTYSDRTIHNVFWSGNNYALPQPRHIVAVSPGEVPWNDEERARMQALNPTDVAIDYAFMEKAEKLMRHGRADVPDYMLAPSRGDYTGVGDIHFYYSADEVLYGALPEFEEACKRANVPYTVTARPGMTHCYCMLPYFKEAKEDFATIVEQLKK